MRRFLSRNKILGLLNWKLTTGRLRCTSELNDRKLKILCLKKRFVTCSELKRDLESSKTVQRRLNEAGVKDRRPTKNPLFTNKIKKTRLEQTRKFFKMVSL